MPLPVFEEVRSACRAVAEDALYVSIDTDSLSRYASMLPKQRLHLPEMDPAVHHLGHGEKTLAYLITLDAVNFGSGYFPHIFGDRRSGYRAVAAALADRYARSGPVTAQALRELSKRECSGIFALDQANPAARELARLYACALNDLGTLLCDRYQGRFEGPVEEAGSSAERLVRILAAMPLYRDVSTLEGREVPFYKRAQLTAVDLHIAFGGEGYGRFDDMDRLTICADNLVPHVLRLDGVIAYSRDLAERVDRGEELPAGSREEVEIRACAVHAAELILAKLRAGGERVNAMELDNLLWHRGQEPPYRLRPRHRTRTTFY